jgi:hypothetical protein
MRRELTHLEQFKNVIAHIIIRETRIENFEFGVINTFEDERGSLGLIVSNQIQQTNNVGATRQILKNFDFSLNLLLLDWFQNLDNTFLVVGHANSFKHFRILSPPNFTNDFIVILHANHEEREDEGREITYNKPYLITHNNILK